jgi:shikimate kinase
MVDHVLLIGMMGSGKSTIGRIVADRMCRPFYDSDAEVERRCHMTVPAIFAERGEAAFRAEERAALCSALASAVPSVIAVAGGAVVDPESRRRLRSGGLVVWLDAAPSALAGRLGTGIGRPLLKDDPAGNLRRLDARRRPIYRELSELAVATGSRPPEAIAEVVVRAAYEHLDATAEADKTFIDGAQVGRS